jgi:hypothetical protein
MRRLLGLGLLAVGVAAAAVIGVRLAGAIGEVASLATAVHVSPVKALPTGTAASELPALATEPAAVAPLEPAADTVSSDEQPLFEESELALEYFGAEVSLNDLGQLASPDPEFDRALRALANERGEIEAHD